MFISNHAEKKQDKAQKRILHANFGLAASRIGRGILMAGRIIGWCYLIFLAVVITYFVIFD